MTEPAADATDSRAGGGQADDARSAPGRAAVAVVGSANIDLIATVGAAPLPGETVLASRYEEEVGGKGVNQAVAAARTAPTALVASVGDDPEAVRVRAYARSRGVDVHEVRDTAERTGRALITLFDQDNTIVVAPLANAALTAEAVDAALERLRPAVVLVQFEIPEDAVRAAALWCRDAGARLLINPSPVRPVAAEVLALADPLVVNLGEAAALVEAHAPAGAPVESTTEAAEAAAQEGSGLGEEGDGTDPRLLARLLARRVRSVVVTAGPGGAWVGGGAGTRHVPVPERVEVVDSSGAGDAFAGHLAASLAVGGDLDAAVAAAVAVATRLVATPRERR